MSRRIAGIDVHKKMLAVVMSKAEIEGEYQFERRMFGSNREQLRSLAACSSSKWPRKSSWNQPRNIESPFGGTGTVLETAPREARRRKAQVQNVAFGAGAVQSRTARTKGRFRRCRVAGETTRSPRIDTELCARCGAASMANGNAQEVSVEVQSGAAAKPSKVSSGRGSPQVVQLGHRSDGCQRPRDAKGAR